MCDRELLPHSSLKKHDRPGSVKPNRHVLIRVPESDNNSYQKKYNCH
ncbi:hypothetical protein KGM_207738 [Danaus plexippus plexippus]|uniref:Uncharacterized protein n=1 Tax=Danaus plexippus plexippus TaxID=278856 RepID=A0A212FL88_DANPL|nr:hypothetical protein KGM_207738 [Danaus plexippus plexippus]